MASVFCLANCRSRHASLILMGNYANGPKASFPHKEALWVARLIYCCCPKQTTIIIIIIWFEALLTFNHLFFCDKCIFGVLIAKLLAFIAAMFGNWNKLLQLAKSCEIHKLVPWQLRRQKICVQRYKILSDPFGRMRFCRRWRHAANKMFIFAHQNDQNDDQVS